MIIYKTTNLINNKIYVGLNTNNNPNYYGSGTLIKKALKKYGKKNFTKEILQECNTIEELNNAEKYWISKLNALVPNGYNISTGGNNNHIIDNKEKIRNWHLNRPRSIETKIKISNTRLKLKIKHSDETKKKISAAGKGRIVSEKTKEKMKLNAKTNLNYGMRGKHIYRYKINKSELIKYYILEGKTREQLSKIYNCSIPTIVRNLKRYSINKIKK